MITLHRIDNSIISYKIKNDNRIGDIRIYIYMHKAKISKKKYLSSKKSLKIQKGNQNPQVEEGQTTQWPKEKRQRDNNLKNMQIKLKIE